MTAAEMIKRYEGYRDKAYKCPAGVWTIGYGRTHGVKKGDVTTQAQEDKWLEEYVAELACQIADSVVPKILTPNQMTALISLVYNIGMSAFKQSTLRKRIMNNDYDGASQEFRRWVYAGGKVLQGLVRRRKEEAEIFRG